MKNITTWLLVALVVVGLSISLEGQAQAETSTSLDEKRFHTIQKGETLYHLTKLYGITAEEICAANPGLSATNFQIGAVVLIPYALTTNVEMVDTIPSVPSPTVGTGIAGSSCREMHKVKKKETLFSISQQYGITVTELMDANPETKASDFTLKKKMVLCIPEHKEVVTEPVEIIPTNEVLFSQARPSVGLKTIRLAVMMPFKGTDNASKSVLDFYRGMLMATEKMKENGLSFEIYAYNTGKAAGDIEKILSRPMMEHIDLIVGPTDPEQIALVSRYSKAHTIPMVLPFYSRSMEINDNPYLFVLNAPDSIRYGEAEKLVVNNFKDYNLLVVDTDAGKVEDFLPYLKRNWQDVRYAKMPMTESVLLSRLDNARKNLIVLSSADIRSLNTFMTVLKNLKQTHPEFQISVLGYPDYLSYTSSASVLDNFHGVDTYVFSSFFLDYRSPMFLDFDKQYRKNFKTEMLSGTPRMALYGYDCGMFFFEGLHECGRNFSGILKLKYPVLQNDFQMERICNWSGLYNRQMNLIHFDSNHEIHIINK